MILCSGFAAYVTNMKNMNVDKPTESVELYLKAKNMLLGSTEILRQLFKNRWKAKSGKDWEETEEQGKQLVAALQKATHLNKDSMARIGSGCLENWDLATLSTILRKCEYMRQFQFRQENEAIFQLSEMRNELSHLATNELSPHDYKERVQLIQSSLLVLGVSQKKIEDIVQKLE